MHTAPGLHERMDPLGLARRVRTVTMKIVGKSRVASRSRLISLVVIFLAAALAFYAFHESNIHPTSSDSSIDADIVHIAAAVGGRIIELPVSENARVTQGALLSRLIRFLIASLSSKPHPTWISPKPRDAHFQSNARLKKHLHAT